jgi:DNA-binding NarL/FixJ family response regulator
VIHVARATGQGATLLVTMTAQAWAELRMGRLDDAETTLGAALDTGRLAPHLFLAVALGLSAVLATYRGDYRAAVRLGEECVRLARTADAGLIPGMSGLYMAVPLIEMGDAERAREIVLEMSRGKPELETSRSGYAPAYEVLARAEVALGRVDAAERWAQRAEAAVGDGALAVESAFARRARATVALACGDASRAAQIALDAAARAADAGAPGEAGRCRILAASALARAGRHSGAIGALEQAVEQLGRIGAHGYRAQAEKELRRLHRSANAQQGVDSLTRREREVAEHVRAGRTNREIAGMLFLSEKTVERHLSRVFEKFGVSSRTAVAVLMAERSTGPTRADRGSA